MAELALYLDAARLGLMSSSARLAAGDFARLAGEDPFTLYGSKFLTVGSMPNSVRARSSRLDGWRGIRGLKQTIRTFVGVPDTAPVALASRTSELMHVAARVLFRTCRHVLLPDTGWGPYVQILERESRRQRRRISVTPIREQLSRADLEAPDLSNLIRHSFRRHQCDGLFLAAISHDGIRLPVREIVDALHTAGDLKFVVVDGAQEFGHTPLRDVDGTADLYLAGCHKWIGAYQPLGIAVAGCERSYRAIREELAVAATDPLLRFTEQLANCQLDGVSETANLAPLFSAHGALLDAAPSAIDGSAAFATQLRNAEAFAHKALESGWRPMARPHFARSGILMLQAERSITRAHSPEILRGRFADSGILLTAYDQGQLRLSMPRRPWTDEEIAILGVALRTLA